VHGGWVVDVDVDVVVVVDEQENGPQVNAQPTTPTSH
jgi:hypothetical protein